MVVLRSMITCFFFFSSRRRHMRFDCDWSSDVCSSDLWRARNNRSLLRTAAHVPPCSSHSGAANPVRVDRRAEKLWIDRKSTRLNSSHSQISYAVFCLKKKKKKKTLLRQRREQ